MPASRREHGVLHGLGLRPGDHREDHPEGQRRPAARGRPTPATHTSDPRSGTPSSATAAAEQRGADDEPDDEVGDRLADEDLRATTADRPAAARTGRARDRGPATARRTSAPGAAAAGRSTTARRSRPARSSTGATFSVSAWNGRTSTAGSTVATCGIAVGDLLAASSASAGARAGTSAPPPAAIAVGVGRGADSRRSSTIGRRGRPDRRRGARSRPCDVAITSRALAQRVGDRARRRRPSPSRRRRRRPRPTAPPPARRGAATALVDGRQRASGRRRRPRSATDGVDLLHREP